MRHLRFQIRMPQGQVEQINVESERVLIGSGAHCEIRLPLDQARVEHVLIELGPAGVFARALSFEPPPTINNIPFTQAPLPPEAVLGVGQTQLYVMVAEGAGGMGAQQAKKKSSPLLVVGLLLMAPAAYYLFLQDDTNDAAVGKSPQPPDLWGPPVTQCPQTPGAQALAFARERLTVADAKRERRPFYVQDGVQSVPLYELAASCFRAGGDPATAQLGDDAARYLRKEINDDYRTERVRLDHSLSVKDYPAALHDVRVLLQYTEGKQGDYVTWLSNIERQLKTKISSKPAT